MICPGTDVDCDNPGCRHGGCQGRPPRPPLFKLLELEQAFAVARRLRETDAAGTVAAPKREPVPA